MRRVEHVMGIPVGIEVRAGDAGEDAVAAAFAHLRRVDALFSPWRATSDVRRLDAGTLAPAAADPEVREVLATCERLRVATGGLFDARATGALDPSGYVKGWALETAARLLAAAGATESCLHAGGDVRVVGGPWRAGVQHPRSPDRLAEVLVLDDAGVATSGAYERGAHVVDPRTGQAPEGVLSVTVVGPDLGLADAYATAAFALGRDAPAFTARLGGYEALTILDDGRTFATPGLPVDEHAFVQRGGFVPPGGATRAEPHRSGRRRIAPT